VAAEQAPVFHDRLRLDTGRIGPSPVHSTSVRFTIHGEYQLRYRAMTDLRLEPPRSDLSATTLGQNHYLYHWLRFAPRLTYRRTLALAGQIDILRGFIVGDHTRHVTAARDSFGETTSKWFEVHPRHLYLEWFSPIGLFRVGAQGSHWGMGVLANDGDHPTLFGDLHRGSLPLRLLYSTTPLGRASPLVVVLAADVIFEDNTADLIDGDRAFQGVAAIVYRKKAAEFGVYGVIRHQSREATSVDALTPYTDKLLAGVVDVTGKFHAPVPGSRAFVYGEIEAAAIFGSTTFARTIYGGRTDPADKLSPSRIRSFGGAATLGSVHVAGRGADHFGRTVVEVEAGYASGDADPGDGTIKRFTFDPNHHVGLVLFNHVLAWKTARAATSAADPAIVNRPAPGLSLLPSNGGIFGAAYLNPRAVVRPVKWIDLKAGLLVAHATADVVDPLHYGLLSDVANYDGGNERSHDLGLEIDLGADFRIATNRGTTIQAGAEGGVLFPGHAFDDARGVGIGNQYLGQIKLGVQY
jgi:hypothetical protein